MQIIFFFPEKNESVLERFFIRFTNVLVSYFFVKNQICFRTDPLNLKETVSLNGLFQKLTQIAGTDDVLKMIRSFT